MLEQVQKVDSGVVQCGEGASGEHVEWVVWIRDMLQQLKQLPTIRLQILLMLRVDCMNLVLD